MVPARRVARLLPGSEGTAAYCVGPVTRTFCACYYARRLGITHVSHEGDADDCCSCDDVTKVGHLFFRARYGTRSSDPIRTGVEGAAARIAKHVSHFAAEGMLIPGKTRVWLLTKDPEDVVFDRDAPSMEDAVKDTIAKPDPDAEE